MDLTRTRAEQRELDKFFRALSHPVRREILLILDSGARHVGDIAAQFDIVRPAISRPPWAVVGGRSREWRAPEAIRLLLARAASAEGYGGAVLRSVLGSGCKRRL